MLDITHFLKTGQLGKIKVGLSIEQFSTQIEPIKEDRKHYYDSDNPHYGFSYFTDGVELMFVDGELSTISVGAAGNQLSILSDYNLSVYTNLEKMLFFLEMLRIDWEFYQKHTFGKQIIIKTEPGVQISFSYDKGHGMLLSKFQHYLDS